MRQTEFDDFDLQVRSMIENAEVKAPSRVWRAVSSRIASGTAAAPAAWLRWAVPALASVAALAAVIFLPGRPESRIHSTGDMFAQLSSPAQLEIPADIPAPERLRAFARTSKTPAAATTATVTDTPTKTNTTSGPVTAQAPEVTPEHSTPATTVPDADPFALMAFEDREASGRTVISLVADGMIGGNDAGRTFSRRGYGAPGEGSASSMVTENSASTYGVPVSFGLGIRFGLSPRFSVGAGVNYTLLSRSFLGSYGSYTGDVSNVQQYLGVPVNLYYDFFNTDVFRFYTFAGGAAEYCLSNKFSLRDDPLHKSVSEPASGFQFSAGLGFGVEFKLSRNVGIYIDPAVRYYFKSNQPRSIRTDHPLMLNFEAGIKFDINNK